MILLTTLKKKVPFKQFQKFLKANDIKPSIGYDKTVEKIYQAIDEGKLDGELFETKTMEFIRDYIVFGQKVVYSYKLNPQEIQDLVNSISISHQTQNQIGKLENLTIWNQTQLDLIPWDSSQLRAIFDIDSLKCLVFSARHSINERVNLSPDLLRTNQGFSELYGVKKIEYQSFDSIIIDTKHNTIDFCLDNYYELTPKNHFNLFMELKNTFRTTFNLVYDFFPENENFYRFVQKYYSAEYGIVKELGFKTETGSVKTERMNVDADDLRKERYHVGGLQAVEEKITPYSIDIILDNTSTGNPNIRKKIPGKHQHLQYASPKIEFYEFYCVLNANDYSFIKDKMYTNN